MTDNLTTSISSKTTTVDICRDKPTVIIGERINPTGRKQVLAALEAGDFDIVRTDAISQVQAGARVLDVNAGVPGADEPTLLQQIMRTVMEVTDVPLCIDTANPLALEAALSIYEGKALVNEGIVDKIEGKVDRGSEDHGNHHTEQTVGKDDPHL